MLIGIIGENCSGKSTLAACIRDAIGAELITGKDYLRMAKSESESKRLFQEKLNSAISGSNIIYADEATDAFLEESGITAPAGVGYCLAVRK